MKVIKRESISALLTVLVISFVTAVTPSRVQVQAQTDARTTPLQSTSNVRASSKPATLAELKNRIDEIVRQPALEPGFFAVKIVSLDSGQVIYEQNANKFVRPASNMKLYTVAAGFDRLTPDFHFVTSVYAKKSWRTGRSRAI
jgi:D-alanyl-D-alanine carboxypeptidase/D-alanyl-D-alanine-endopeptidase (penicillin-binding protein 4)